MSVSPPKYSVYLRNADYTLIEKLDVWTSLTFVKRFNSVGTWNLEVPKKAKISQYITPDIGIILQRDGETIFSGPSGFTPEYYYETKDTIKISGVDDNILLETLARPTPSQAAAPYADAYDVVTGVASTVMRSLVTRNIGASAPTEWKIPELSMGADPLLGSAITARARFDPLIVLLSDLASTPTATGLGFDIVQNDLLPTLLFNIYSPTDNTETNFSVEMRTVENYEWKHQIPAANWFVVAGGDDFGINRTIVEGGDAENIAAVGRRISEFVDARGITDTSELNQKLAEKIATVVTADIFNITPTDVPSIQYGTHYNLGDLVTVTIEGTAYQRIIREITIDWGVEEGVKITPTIADPSGTNDDILAQHMYTLQNRLSNIERNFNVPDNSIIADMLHETMRTYVGDVKLTTRGSVQPGWLLCNGAAISRTTYSTLFGIIGTLCGVGDGSTTFNIPDFRNRFPLGAPAISSVGNTGGSTTASLGSHSHTHSHGGGSLTYSHVHTSQAHTHPGSHSHGLSNHTHTTNINHDHPSFDSGGTNIDSVAIGHASLGSGATDHHHSVNVPALGTTNVASGVPSNNSSDTDSNAHAASYSGSPSGQSSTSWSGGSDSDSTAGSGGDVNVLNPYQTINYMIYTGVVV